MPEWENELDGEPEISEEQAGQLWAERLEEIELQIEQDEHPLEPETDEQPERAKLKRELKDEALTRLEDAARTTADFNEVIRLWNIRDANRERRERYHEVLRDGDEVPLDYGASPDARCIPHHLNRVLTRQVRRGDFLDAIFNCLFEIQELVSDGYVFDILKDLNDEQKELLFLWAVREYSSVRIAAIRSQSDRNVRKVRNTLIKRMQKKLLAALKEKEASGRPLTNRERAFLSENKKSALDESKDG